MKFKLSFIQDEEQIERLKSKLGGWPFKCGGIEWTEKTTHECDDLTPFFYSQRLATDNLWKSDYIEGVDSRLIVTVLTKPKEEQNKNELSETKD